MIVGHGLFYLLGGLVILNQEDIETIDLLLGLCGRKISCCFAGQWYRLLHKMFRA